MRTDVGLDDALTDDLRGVIAAALSAEYGKSAVKTIERARCAMSSSYPAEVVTVGLADGQNLRIFLKDLSTRSYDAELSERRRREIAVYRDLLDGADLGTARYYGSVEDPVRNRFWLLLEHVEGPRVEDEPFDVWVLAAVWLGRMQAYIAAHPDALNRCRRIQWLAPEYFLSMAAMAKAAAAAYGPELAERVVGALDGYAHLVANLASQPPMFVHGGYRPQNMLRRSTGAYPRICPVDWEAAAIGPTEFDLAYLCEGFDDRRRGILVDAYRMEAARHGLRVHQDDEADVRLDACDLHKNLKTLSKAVDRHFPLAGVQKLVRMIEVAAARALQGRTGTVSRSQSLA